MERVRSGRDGPSGWDLGFARLAIVDLSEAGGQPMSNEDDTLVMVFNGEIYNSPELRALCVERGHSFRSEMDGEVILHLWEDEGPEALARLNGIFAVAVYDTRSGALHLARDPLGVKPLFVASDDSALWFGSEINAVLAAGAPDRGQDLVALAQFLTFLWLPDPLTPRRGVTSVLPGHVLTWHGGRIHTRRFTDPLVPSENPRQLSPGDAREELAVRLRAAVHRQLLSDVPIGIMASGGIDSSLIWCEAGSGIERAFTITWEGDDTSGEGLSEDTAAVRDLERLLGTPVDYIAGERDDSLHTLSGDLFADPAHALTRSIARASRERGYKVLFSGQGGDELFGGYRRHRTAALLEHFRVGRPAVVAERALRKRGGGLRVEYAARLARALAQRDPLAAYMQLCTYSTADDRARALGCTTREVRDSVVWARHRQVWESLPPGVTFLRRAMALDLNVYLPGLGLAYIDRAAMEHGVEVRVPWLDLELVRWSLSLPDSALMRRGRGKWLPQALAAERLPRHITHRPKRGFAAPLARVKKTAAPQGQRGFRQSHYFDLAASLLPGGTGERSPPGQPLESRAGTKAMGTRS